MDRAKKRVDAIFAGLNGTKIPADRPADSKIGARNSSPLCQCQCRP
jgi:hypothetical protein